MIHADASFDVTSSKFGSNSTKPWDDSTSRNSFSFVQDISSVEYTAVNATGKRSHLLVDSLSVKSSIELEPTHRNFHASSNSPSRSHSHSRSYSRSRSRSLSHPLPTIQTTTSPSSSHFNTDFSNDNTSVWNQYFGIALVLLTVILWTISNFLASDIFADKTYSKPYFTTYINSTFFIVPLVYIILKRLRSSPTEASTTKAELSDIITGIGRIPRNLCSIFFWSRIFQRLSNLRHQIWKNLKRDYRRVNHIDTSSDSPHPYLDDTNSPTTTIWDYTVEFNNSNLSDDSPLQNSSPHYADHDPEFIPRQNENISKKKGNLPCPSSDSCEGKTINSFELTDTHSTSNHPPSSHRLPQHSHTTSPIVVTHELSPLSRTITLHPKQLSLKQTARLGLEFSILWFSANYLIAVCLGLTTVSSSTILSSTSGVWTLLIGAAFGVERFTYPKFIAVIASLAGVALISSIDLSGQSDELRGTFPHKSFREIALGDSMALITALLYGIYSVLMKKRLSGANPNNSTDHSSIVNMPVFFGFVGLYNSLLLWPGFILLHFSNIEPFSLPTSTRVIFIIFANSLSSLASDLCWAQAVLLTSPLLVTLALCLTIPLSLVIQMWLDKQSTSPLYWLGALLVISSFVSVAYAENRSAKASPPPRPLSSLARSHSISEISPNKNLSLQSTPNLD